MSEPPHPSLIPRIPMRYEAEIVTHDGWWFRYVVHRTHGVFIPENGVSLHRSLVSARRAAERWTRKNGRESTVVERHDG